MRFGGLVATFEHAQRHRFAQIDQRGERSRPPSERTRSGISSKSQLVTSSRVSSISVLRENASRACPSHCARNAARSRPLASVLPFSSCRR
jgi:hypothetical protein